MKKTGLFLIIIALISGCRKDKLKGNKEGLIGEWNWIYTIYRGDLCTKYPYQNQFTPVDINTNYSIIFFERGVVQIKKNNNLLEEGKIKFDYWGPKDPIDGYGFDMHIVGHKEKVISARLNGDSLIVSRSYFFEEDNSCYAGDNWCCSNICH